MRERKPTGTVPTHVRQHFLSQSRSGLNIRQYCAKHSISVGTYYQWRKRYRSQPIAAQGNQLSFADLGVLAHSGSVCDIRFPSGTTVSVHRGISHDELAVILDLLAAKQPC